jgi:hypothetical protein
MKKRVFFPGLFRPTEKFTKKKIFLHYETSFHRQKKRKKIKGTIGFAPSILPDSPKPDNDF